MSKPVFEDGKKLPCHVLSDQASSVNGKLRQNEATEEQRKGQESRIYLPQVARPLEAWKASGCVAVHSKVRWQSTTFSPSDQQHSQWE